MSIGENIKQLRQKNNLTQEELASKIYVTRNAISKWETDKGIPSIDNLKQLATLFKVSLDLIVNEDDRIALAMVNTEKIRKFNDIISSVAIFFAYSLSGILIPYIFFTLNRYDDPAIDYSLLPLIYILIGLISVLREISWKYLLIGSALAMIPVYMFYDILLPESTLGLIGLGHYVLFVTAYFLMDLCIRFLQNRFDSAILKKVFMYTAILITGAYVIHTIIASIYLYNCFVCSAPWYLEVVINSLLYAVPIAIPVILYFHFSQISAK